MDNRRVMKAYRDRSREKVLPYPTRGGLLSRVKRYFSAGSPQVTEKVQQSRSTTQPIPASANKSILPRLESFSVTVNDSVAEGDQTTNRILSSFFQEKGDRPLTQVEYEGVMSLLEKSKASITLPLPESPEKPTAPDDNSELEARQNHTFAPYSQKILRNTSMLDANSTSLATPDYKPVYHTFSDTSRGNTSVKRVYQFSGLPSPYRTRIRAPNLNARRAKRLTTATGTSTASAGVSEGTSTAASIAGGELNGDNQDSAQKQMSNTANSLLSILDGGNSKELVDSTSSVKLLHNPFARSKRKNPISLNLPAKRHTTFGANDISKTVLHSKVDELDEKKDETTTFTFGKPDLTEVNGKNVQNNSDAKQSHETKSESKIDVNETDKKENTNGTQKPFGLLFSRAETNATENGTNGESKPSLFNTTLPRFNFGEKSSEQKAPTPTTFGFSKKEEPKAAENGSATFSFGKPQVQEPAPSNGFTFGPSKPTEKPEPLPAFNKVGTISAEKPEESSLEKPLFGFGTLLKKEETTLEKPLFGFGVSKADAPKTPAFNFGSNEGTDVSKAPVFNLGSKPANEYTKAPAFNFGNKPATEETKVPKFGFGSKSSTEETKVPTFDFGSKPSLEESGAPTFGFGSKAGTEAAKTPAFNFGSQPMKNTDSNSSKDEKPAFSFGNFDSKSPAFSFGKPSVASLDTPETKGTHEVSESNGNANKGAPSAISDVSFTFPPVKVITGEVDEAKVEEFKSLFKF